MPKPVFPQWLNTCSSVVQDKFTEYVFCVVNHVSCVQLFATLWTVARQAPLSMGLSRQEYWSRLPPPDQCVHSPLISACQSLIIA